MKCQVHKYYQQTDSVAYLLLDRARLKLDHNRLHMGIGTKATNYKVFFFLTLLARSLYIKKTEKRV